MRCARQRLLAVLLVILIAVPVPLISARATEMYFYKGRDFGSEALYNPLNVILNGGYDIIQLEGQSREILGFAYRAGARNVLRNLANPFGPISRYGWGRFISKEILPLSLSRKGAQWLPNYQLHLIGGGLTYRAVYEWYDYYGFAAPRILSLTTMAAYHLLNETVENHAYQGDNVDPIADIYFFDVGGIILFSFEGVDRFFSEKLNLADWSLMPSLRLRDLTLQNNGQNFVMKWRLPFAQRWYFFHYFGLLGLTGASYDISDVGTISVGIGARAKALQMVDESRHQQSVQLAWNAGVFYDRGNSLLMSFLMSGSVNKGMNLNIYPGLFRMGRVSPGLWIVVGRNGNNVIGVTSTLLMPGAAF